MKKEKLPFPVKFKKLAAKKPLYFESGYVSNGHFIFDIDWLLGLNPSDTSLGFKRLKTRILKERAAYVIARLSDTRIVTAQVVDCVNSFQVEEFRAAKECVFQSGYRNGNPENKGAVSMSFTVSGSPRLDIEYAAACFFDPSAVVMVRDNRSPILLLSGSKVVGIIMGFRPSEN